MEHLLEKAVQKKIEGYENEIWDLVWDSAHMPTADIKDAISKLVIKIYSKG